MKPAELLPFKDFESASEAVLEYLQTLTGFRLWMVTRTEAEDWIVLAARDSFNEVEAGTVYSWRHSFCYHMVTGKTPFIAPDAQTVDLYRQSVIAQRIQIGAYIGMPIMHADGMLLGTLCGIDPQPADETIQIHAPLLKLLSKQLGTLFELENQLEREQRLRERLEAESLSDDMTNVYNRRGWQQLLGQEEQRCQRYGHPVGILIIDLDELKLINDTHGHDAGDQLLVETARVLRESSRTSDIVARLGGDEFGILCVETNIQQTEKLGNRVQLALANAGISASVGWSARHGEMDMQDILRQADRMMYQHKYLRKTEQQYR